MQTDSNIRSRIKTISGLNSIFSAMQMVTVSKLAKIRGKRGTAVKYRQETASALELLDPPAVPQDKKQSGRIACVLIAGNHGLCGAFNQEIIFRASSFLKEHGGRKIDFFVFGRHGFDFLKSRKQNIKEAFFIERLDFGVVASLAKKLWLERFDEVYLIHSHFYSLLKRKAVADRVFPYEGKPSGRLVISEASYGEVLFAYFEAVLYSALCDSFLGEFSSRLATLKAAIDNSKKIIDRLVIERNKSRQMAITMQIVEIIEASESIKEDSLR
ncbi:hypothetical protein A2276_03670 [candidate division WOR-1 bacterium RIFOXYA12_FULL_43_27]|uniref:ATP synthase F1 subunit gamma n=1 Tax=candidate division WOR-1 bacterium RIFOXYC2_FULL_46_14 TaxID=1802587 RepID=A0A1F4U766_UNCSA|nr:MAG: hypothetical protein A2276_03670 [candidate division WOR-1 bacterium RIFOXYA12_FULL_43_27]OGC19207.1 MAG: hypothetical protein A2292_00665 [candidate division WOR-1 bacterium RIFOXYB2_FULL_46_45]OGC30196.1 MAG: hypothetical protein A2232_00665 [candidate division WOR-1 bacterium RIFOXYA2_FULL_46_56]OGC40798.1 MAG: hypothetical protein A2438_00670 [candidate division WOR-1 bacterium RIFOXYC2_FULL_46_14]